jgi:hypothetical protein
MGPIFIPQHRKIEQRDIQWNLLPQINGTISPNREIVPRKKYGVPGISPAISSWVQSSMSSLLIIASFAFAN